MINRLSLLRSTGVCPLFGVFVLLAPPPVLAQSTERVSVSSTGVQGEGASSEVAISADGRFVAFASRATTLVQPDTNGPISDVYLRDRWNGTTELVSIRPNGSRFDQDTLSPTLFADGRYVAFATVWPGEQVYVRDRMQNQTIVVSVNRNGHLANNTSFSPWISRSGRHVAFVSYATNLDPFRPATNSGYHVYVHDRDADGDGIWDEQGQPGAIETVRVDLGKWNPSLGGFEEANNTSDNPSISEDGRFVAFTSAASNLDPLRPDTNGFADAFVHDRDADGDGIFDEQADPNGVRTIRVNISSAFDPNQPAGHQEANHFTYAPIISANGRHVAFLSHASNLVNDDVPPLPGWDGAYVHDRDADHDGVYDEQDQPGGTRTVLVSRDSTGVPETMYDGRPFPSADGRFVAFLGVGHFTLPYHNSYPHVILRDRDADGDGVFDEAGQSATTRVSISTTCEQSNERSGFVAAISDSGQCVAFSSHAYNLVSDDTNNQPDIYVRDRGTCLVPSITMYPVSQSAHVCDEVVLETHAIGDPPLMYQWRKYGTPNDPNTAVPVIDDPNHIWGATSPTLVIDPRDPNDSGMYDCVVTNNCLCSETWSAPATLTVSWRLGDMNCDGVVDFFDIDPFVCALQGPPCYQPHFPECRYLNGDCDGDGYVTFFDIDPFVARLGDGCP